MTDPTTNTAALFETFDKEMMSGLNDLLNFNPSALMSSLDCEFLNLWLIVAFYSFQL
jgi:hypothetical protein